MRDQDGSAQAALCISLPTVRYDRERLPQVVGVLDRAAAALAPAL